MSEPSGWSSPPPVPTPPGATPPGQRSGCLTAFMIVAGIILLLPGLCAVIFGVGSLAYMHFDQDVMGLVTLGLVIGFGGVMLIVSAIRGRR
jgi:hypothetical protein